MRGRTPVALKASSKRKRVDEPFSRSTIGTFSSSVISTDDRPAQA
jgi:hypothetical protein